MGASAPYNAHRPGPQLPSDWTALYGQKHHIFLDMRHMLNYVHSRKDQKLIVVQFPALRGIINNIDGLYVRSVV
jgi:hypothetical protein